MSAQTTLRVSTIRSQNPMGFGGCIFTGPPIDEHGNAQDARVHYVVKASTSVLGTAQVQIGQWWRVSGDPKQREIVVNGYQLTEWQIDAKEAVLLLPSGEHIVTLIAESADFTGIGLVKARKLWERFGEELYVILDQGKSSALEQLLTAESAQQVVKAWAVYGDTRTLQWLQAKGFDHQVGRKILDYFGADAAKNIEADPYRLLSFCASWKQVDRLAREQFAVGEDDARRLQGAVEEACYRLFGDGHTVATRSMLMEHLASVLGVSSTNWQTLIPDALAKGETNGSYVIGAHQDLHPLGPYVMERVVAQAVADRLRQTPAPQLLSSGEVSTLTTAYEATEKITLNDAQRCAVQTAAAYAFACITGDAGTGKTTVLKALYHIYDKAGVRVYQLALAGRAARRMAEATGRSASTIASFLKQVKERDLNGPCVVIVDEASMLDIITMSRLCELLPPHVRLVLVGDPSQLMPVGPGLVLHALVDTPGIPLVELTDVKRHGGKISAAAAIRQGTWPNLPNNEFAPIAFIPSGNGENIAETILQLYTQNPDNTQILSSLRQGPTGTKGLNTLCQNRFTVGGRPLTVWNTQYEQPSYTGFRLGDPLLCTRNMWEWSLQNGSIGKLVQIEDEPRLLTNEEGVEVGYALAYADWDDGERRPIFEAMLDDLELGYAITVHKSQGSQWERIIVPITGNRLLDRTLLYTAVTRAQEQVILVGDEGAARRAVESVPRAHHRRVALGSVLAGLLTSSGEGVA